MSQSRLNWAVAAAFAVLGGASAWADTVQLDQQYAPASVTQVANLEDRSLWNQFAQTFTVGLAGILDHVDLDLLAANFNYTDKFGNAASIYGSGDMIVDIRAVSGGTPSSNNVGGDILASVTVFASALPHSTHGWYSIDFSNAATGGGGLTLINGQMYAIGIRDVVREGAGAGADTYIYGGSVTPTYGAGQSWVSHDQVAPGVGNLGVWDPTVSDFAFRTWVLAPLRITAGPTIEVDVVPLPSAAWMGFGLLGALGAVGLLKRRSVRQF